MLVSFFRYRSIVRFIALSLGQMKLTHAIYMLNTLYMLLMSELSGSYRGGLGNVRNTRCEVKGAEKKCLSVESGSGI